MSNAVILLLVLSSSQTLFDLAPAPPHALPASENRHVSKRDYGEARSWMGFTAASGRPVTVERAGRHLAGRLPNFSPRMSPGFQRGRSR